MRERLFLHGGKNQQFFIMIESLNHSYQKIPENPKNTFPKTLFLDHSWCFDKNNFQNTPYLLRWCVFCVSGVPRISSIQLSIFSTKSRPKCIDLFAYPSAILNYRQKYSNENAVVRFCWKICKTYATLHKDY